MTTESPSAARRIAVAAAICLSLAAPALAQTPDPLRPAADGGAQSIPLTPDPGRRLTLAVRINGQGPFDFLVDTGSERTVISRELAATLSLRPGPTVRLHETTGTDDVGAVMVDRLEIGDRQVEHIAAPALAAADLGAAGILGIDALRDLHLVMDFRAMRLTTTASRPEPVLEGDTIVVRGRGRFGQLVLVDSKIHGVRVFVVLDSGSQISIGNPELLKLLTGRDTSPAPGAVAEITSVTGRKRTVELDQIDEATVGGLTIRNMKLAFAPLPIFDHLRLTRQPALLLGMDVLGRCQRVSVDLRRREATFTLNAP
jgi:predicted aspartyl protease